MERNKNTTAKRRVKAGHAQVIDPESGELKNVQHYEVKDVDINWNKVWLGHLLDVLEMVGSKKMKVISWLLENRNTDTNEVFATQQLIMDETALSKKTVSETFKVLQTANVIKKVRNGVWQLSPNFIWKGESQNRMDILFTYKKD